MSQNWCKAYEELTRFIAEKPQIKLGQELMEIPEDCRVDFYERFNAVRSALVQDECAQMMEQAAPLVESYRQSEKEILANPSLNTVDIPPRLRWFISDPVDGLRRVLYDPLFNLLRDRISIEQFQSIGAKSSRMLAAISMVQCYQCWLALSLANRLKPQGFFSVNLDLGTSSIASVQAAQQQTQRVNDPEPSDTITLYNAKKQYFHRA